VKRIFVVCEGQTEVNFVKRLLTPYFVSQTKTFIPVTVLTKRDNRQGKMYKGGMSSFAKAHITIEKTLANLKDKDTFVTTMFDFYKLPSDTPGMDKMTDINNSYKKVELLENEIRTFDIKRLIIQLHLPNGEPFVPYRGCWENPQPQQPEKSYEAPKPRAYASDQLEHRFYS